VIFHSLDFVVFFVLTVALYWCLPRRAQNLLLVVSSYVFYGYVHPWFVALVGSTTLLDYGAGRGMAAYPARRRWFLGLSLAGNLGLLGFFKYFNFFAENVHQVLGLVGLDVPPVALRLLLPVGVSFYTFQELSYTIDVYRGRIAARRDLLDFAAFVCFFPQLVAGPIERAAHLLPQVEAPRRFSWELARQALFLMIWGYFKKLVIADNVGVIANKVFTLAHPSFPVLWAGVLAFGIQIYADFSAYSDIARGAARWLGFDLMRNFDHPYLARGPAEFWRRWHISLSTWFRDYVYIPLGGSRVGRWRAAGNVMATFVLSGLWHGAS
jgi:alginate O-acetyltransferase complex protein AlgI